jgi:maltokinase
VPDSNAGLMDILAGWLPEQRWFPGRGRPLSELAIISDVTLRGGNPALRHLIVEAHLRSGPTGSGPGGTVAARFQVLVGYRTELPASLRTSLIGYLDGTACYDALHDRELADVLLSGIREQQIAGPLRFVREPGAPVFFGEAPDSRVLGAEQSNTSLVFGEQAILKVLRRLFPGANPDLEVADGLARLGSARVAAPYGWIETDLDGEPVLLGVLSRFLAGASDGWSLALSGLHQLYASEGAYGREYLPEPVAVANGQAPGTIFDGSAPAGVQAAPPFLPEARQLGLATAELHADMARAFGSRAMTATELSGLAAEMNGKLTLAIEIVPELASFQTRIRSAYDAVGQLAGPVTVQRVHGDYHLGQVLLGPQGWVALDFEGEPAVPLEVRRAPGPALRDVAGMLRSFDYAARHQLVGHPDAARLAAAADAWVRQCQVAFCAGYAAGGGTDPDGHGTLLRALTLEKAVYEVVYEYRHRPTWLSIPLDFVASA